MLRRTFPCHRGGFVGADGIRSLGGQRSFSPLSSGNECVLGGPCGEPCRDFFFILQIRFGRQFLTRSCFSSSRTMSVFHPQRDSFYQHSGLRLSDTGADLPGVPCSWMCGGGSVCGGGRRPGCVKKPSVAFKDPLNSATIKRQHRTTAEHFCFIRINTENRSNSEKRALRSINKVALLL